MRLAHRSHFTRLVARVLCWVMLSAWAAGVANACAAPGAGAALSGMAVQVLHGAASSGAHASSEPCHAEHHGLPDSRGPMEAGACKTLCEAEPSGLVAVKGDLSPPTLALLLPEPRQAYSPDGVAAGFDPSHPSDKPPSPPAAILFLRLTI